MRLGELVFVTFVELHSIVLRNFGHRRFCAEARFRVGSRISYLRRCIAVMTGIYLYASLRVREEVKRSRCQVNVTLNMIWNHLRFLA